MPESLCLLLTTLVLMNGAGLLLREILPERWGNLIELLLFYLFVLYLYFYFVFDRLAELFFHLGFYYGF